MTTPLFKPGQVVATPGVIEALEGANQQIWEFLSLHVAGDWGIVDAEDKESNNEALKDGGRLLSAYLLDDEERTKIWLLTEAEDDDGIRVSTTALLPEEY